MHLGVQWVSDCKLTCGCVSRLAQGQEPWCKKKTHTSVCRKPGEQMWDVAKREGSSKHWYQSLKKHDYTVISLHRCARICGRSSSWSVSFSPAVIIGESDVAACVAGGGQRRCVHGPGGNRALSLVPAVWQDFRIISLLTAVCMLRALAVYLFHLHPTVQAFLGSQKENVQLMCLFLASKVVRKWVKGWGGDCVCGSSMYGQVL